MGMAGTIDVLGTNPANRAGCAVDQMDIPANIDCRQVAPSGLKYNRRLCSGTA